MLDAIVDLRLASRRSLRLLGDPAMARARLRVEWKDAIASARSDGVLEVLSNPSGELVAAFVIRPNPSPFFSGDKVDLLLRGRDRRARAWMRERIVEHAPALRRDVNVHLSRDDADLVPDLERIGLYVSSICLAGDPRRALGRLRRKYGEPEWSGVECRPLETRRQVSAIVQLMREEFTRNPQFGEFVRTRRFLSAHAADLRGRIDDASGNHWVLVRGGKLVGHFGFPYVAKTSFGCSVAALGVTFDRDLQGKGQAKNAYLTALERMVELDVRLWMGLTSQLPVMWMGAIMGRRWIGYELRAGRAWFPREHFRYPPEELSAARRRRAP